MLTIIAEVASAQRGHQFLCPRRRQPVPFTPLAPCCTNREPTGGRGDSPRAFTCRILTRRKGDPRTRPAAVCGRRSPLGGRPRGVACGGAPGGTVLRRRPSPSHPARSDSGGVATLFPSRLPASSEQTAGNVNGDRVQGSFGARVRAVASCPSLPQQRHLSPALLPASAGQHGCRRALFSSRLFQQSLSSSDGWCLTVAARGVRMAVAATALQLRPCFAGRC